MGKGDQGRWRLLRAIQEAALPHHILPCILTVCSNSEVSTDMCKGSVYTCERLCGIMQCWGKSILTYKRLCILCGVEAGQPFTDSVGTGKSTLCPTEHFSKDWTWCWVGLNSFVMLQQWLRLTLPLGPLGWRSCFRDLMWLQESKWPELNWEKKAILSVLVRITSNITDMSNMCLCCFSCDLTYFLFWKLTFERGLLLSEQLPLYLECNFSFNLPHHSHAHKQTKPLVHTQVGRASTIPCCQSMNR